MDLRNMSDKVLQNVLDKALSAGETDLSVMVKNELLRRDHSAHEETRTETDHSYFHYDWPGAVSVHHPHEPRLWPPRRRKSNWQDLINALNDFNALFLPNEAQPIAPHNTAALIAALEDWRREVAFPHIGGDLLGKAIEQLRWYAETRAADEVGY